MNVKSALGSGKLFLSAASCCNYWSLGHEGRDSGMLPKRRDIGKVEVLTPRQLFFLFVWKSNATRCSVFYLATPLRIYLESRIGQVTQQECEPGWVHWGLACCSYFPTSSYFLPPSGQFLFVNSQYCWLTLGLHSIILCPSQGQWVGKNVFCHSQRGELKMPLESRRHSYLGHQNVLHS